MKPVINKGNPMHKRLKVLDATHEEIKKEAGAPRAQEAIHHRSNQSRESSTMKDKDLPMVKHFHDDYIWIAVDKETIEGCDTYPYFVRLYTPEEVLFVFYYKTIRDAELAFKMMCRGV